MKITRMDLFAGDRIIMEIEGMLEELTEALGLEEVVETVREFKRNLSEHFRAYIAEIVRPARISVTEPYRNGKIITRRLRTGIPERQVVCGKCYASRG